MLPGMGPNVAKEKKAPGKLAAGHHLLRPRSMFAPNRRIMINAVPILLNVLLPWSLFTGACGLLTFDPNYYYPRTVMVTCVLLGLLVLAYGTFAKRSREDEPEPTWYPMSAFICLVAFVTATYSGWYNYNTYMRKYFEITDLKMVGHLDASLEKGGNMLDSGIAYFATGTELDGLQAWHFKHGTTYCVAPITKLGATGASHDFWAVGKDCCALGASDFRCGDWTKPGVRAGIRALEAGDQEYYQLAVKQAESLYGIKASHPIFFYWSRDPVADVDKWWKDGFIYFVLQSSCMFVFAVVTVTLSTCCFSFLGRERSGYVYADRLAYHSYQDSMNYQSNES